VDIASYTALRGLPFRSEELLEAITSMVPASDVVAQRIGEEGGRS
jgi:hypothetical protein